MNIPIIIITDQDKVKFLYRAIELLRLEHNEKGKVFREGKMTEKEFRDYQNYDFEPRNQKLFSILNPIKDKLGMFQMSKEKNPNDPRLAYKEDGKKETKWDKDIDLTGI